MLLMVVRVLVFMYVPSFMLVAMLVLVVVSMPMRVRMCVRVALGLGARAWKRSCMFAAVQRAQALRQQQCQNQQRSEKLLLVWKLLGAKKTCHG
jgi:hypothetical protein